MSPRKGKNRKHKREPVDPNFTIRPYKIEDINRSLDEEEFFAFPKLLHGFWDVIRKHTETREGWLPLRQELAETPFKRLECHGPLLDMMRDPMPHVKWGVGAVGNHKHLPSPLNIALMNRCFNPSHVLYDGLVWKRAIIENNIEGFLKAIRKYKVIVIGKEKIKSIDIGMPFEFVEVKHMTLEANGAHKDSVPMTREDLWEIWHECHEKQKGEAVVYLVQLAYIGCWVMGQTEFKNSFVFDLGIALNYWLEPGKRPKHPWLKFVND